MCVWPTGDRAAMAVPMARTREDAGPPVKTAGSIAVLLRRFQLLGFPGDGVCRRRELFAHSIYRGDIILWRIAQQRSADALEVFLDLGLFQRGGHRVAKDLDA